MENVLKTTEKPIEVVEKNSEEETKKLLFPSEINWKSQRKKVYYRPKVENFMDFVNGAGFIASLVATYFNAPYRIQGVCYLLVLTSMIACDTLHLFSRWLASATRYLIVVCCGLLTVYIITLKYELLVVLVIIATVTFILSCALNSRWLKAENWLMSSVVERALYGDKDNEVNQAYNAHGMRETRTALHSVGVEPKDEDLREIFILPYSIGYMNARNKYLPRVRQLEKELNHAIDVVAEAEYDEEKYEKMKYDLKKERDSRQFYQSIYEQTRKKYEHAIGLDRPFDIVPEGIQKEEVEEQKEEIVLNLPKNVTEEQYFDICERLDVSQSIYKIEKETGIKRYSINKIIEMRGEQDAQGKN